MPDLREWRGPGSANMLSEPLPPWRLEAWQQYMALFYPAGYWCAETWWWLPDLWLTEARIGEN